MKGKFVKAFSAFCNFKRHVRSTGSLFVSAAHPLVILYI